MNRLTSLECLLQFTSWHFKMLSLFRDESMQQAEDRGLDVGAMCERLDCLDEPDAMSDTAMTRKAIGSSGARHLLARLVTGKMSPVIVNYDHVTVSLLSNF